MKTRVKICGITSADDALFAAGAGADFLGYIFYPPSKRYIAPEQAADIIASIRETNPMVRHVGVFVDENIDTITSTRHMAGLDFIQLHGRETPDYCDALTEQGISIIKMLGIGDAGAHIDGSVYHANYYLCDTHDEHLKGGTGRRFDLSQLPVGLPVDRAFLAGGLTPDNISDLLRQIQPFGVDVSTGVETGPGIKSHKLVKSFIQNVRNAISLHAQEG